MQNTDFSPKSKAPSRHWYWLALLIFIISPILAIDYAVDHIKHQINQSRVIQLPIGIQHTLNLRLPGSYAVFTEVNDKKSDRALKRSETFIQIIQLPTGLTLPVDQTKAPDLNFITNKSGLLKSKANGKNKKVTYIATIDIPIPGQYKIYLSGERLQRTYLVDTHYASSVVWVLTKAFLIALFGILISFILALVIFARRSNVISPFEPKDNSISSTEVVPEEKTMTKSNNDSTGNIWAMLCHLTGFCGFLFPLGNIIVPLIIWASLKDRYAFVNQQGREAINFQISIIIYYIIAAILVIILIGFLLLFLVLLFQLILIIIASIETAKGRGFRYPLTIRFIRPVAE